MVQKLYCDAPAALDGLLHDGMTIAAGGFGLCGIPETLIDAIEASGVTGITAATESNSPMSKATLIPSSPS